MCRKPNNARNQNRAFFGKTYTTRYESGCRLNSLELIKGPFGFDTGVGRDRLACDMALGLKPCSVGPEKECFDGWS